VVFVGAFQQFNAVIHGVRGGDGETLHGVLCVCVVHGVNVHKDSFRAILS
jgi:hypothetical protein